VTIERLSGDPRTEPSCDARDTLGPGSVFAFAIRESGGYYEDHSYAHGCREDGCWRYPADSELPEPIEVGEDRSEKFHSPHGAGMTWFTREVVIGNCTGMLTIDVGNQAPPGTTRVTRWLTVEITEECPGFVSVLGSPRIVSVCKDDMYASIRALD
jgi:hypothetical protein